MPQELVVLFVWTGVALVSWLSYGAIKHYAQHRVFSLLGSALMTTLAVHLIVYIAHRGPDPWFPEAVTIPFVFVQSLVLTGIGLLFLAAVKAIGRALRK